MELRSELQAIIGTATIDSAFRRRLLESPASIVDEFTLTPTEREAVLAIRADSLSDFATKLGAWVEGNNNHAHAEASGDNPESPTWVLLG
ncbi:MAG: Os1348 family NHLP clan protein [Anaerolineae bacterium]